MIVMLAPNAEQISEAKAFYVTTASLLFCCSIKIKVSVNVRQPWF
jgi:hypothetical protein